MGYTWDDAERELAEERYAAELIKQHRELIISDFVEERLASYFEDNSNLAEHAIGARLEARNLISSSPSATVVFALSAIEITVQDVLLKPVVAGLTHNPDLGGVLARLVDIRNRRVEKSLFALMETFGIPQIADRTLPSGVNVWKERDTLQDLRNHIVHRGARASSEEALQALMLADFFLDDLYPSVRGHFTRKSPDRM